MKRRKKKKKDKKKVQVQIRKLARDLTNIQCGLRPDGASSFLAAEKVKKKEKKKGIKINK